MNLIWKYQYITLFIIKKKRFKDKIGIMCDVALDPYTSHGHDGIYQNHDVVNDETIKISNSTFHP